MGRKIKKSSSWNSFSKSLQYVIISDSEKERKKLTGKGKEYNINFLTHIQIFK